MDDRVAVIGAGSWGTTLAKVLGDNGRKVWLWTRREELARGINDKHENADYLPNVRLPDNVEATHDLERIAESCHLILMVVPSHGMRAAARELGDFLSGEHVLIHASKGIEEGSFKRMSEILREETCVRKIGVLSGPNLAKELANKQPTGTLVASHFDEVYERAAAVLNNDYFRVYGGRDVIGAEVGGAFKNIVALAAGVAAGLGFGENTHPVRKAPFEHQGIDVPQAEGTSVQAALGGVVRSVDAKGTADARGRYIVLQHGRLETRYYHLAAVRVAVGQQVEAGEVIGEVGNSGVSTGPHLHFEVREMGTPVDPGLYYDLGR